MSWSKNRVVRDPPVVAARTIIITQLAVARGVLTAWWYAKETREHIRARMNGCK